jgi:pimeloyl-ACP methyl ester carboxylesterase/DNA-binding CsgD family transcriptional regulator
VQYARTTDGVSIAYASTGDGPPLVLMPSLPLGNFVGEWQVPVHRHAYRRMAQDTRLIQYDSRGSGHSQRDVAEIKPEAMLRDLDAVVQATGIERFALLGMYLGTTYAISYALAHPERVSHLVLFGGSARGWDAMGARQTQALLSLIEQDWDTFVTSAIHTWMGWSAGEGGRLETEAARDSTTPAITRATLQATSGLDYTDQLAEIPVPVLVFHQRGVQQIPLESSLALAAGFPHGRLCVLEGSAASLFVEDFDSVLRELHAFLGISPMGGDALIRPRHATEAPGPGALTNRQTEVLRLLAQGETNAEIAHRLGISVHTVERHVANLYRRIDARGRADATAFAVRRGIA